MKNFQKNFKILFLGDISPLLYIIRAVVACL